MEKKTIPVSKIIVPLRGNVDDVKSQVQLSYNVADMFEARFDLLQKESLAFIKSLKKPLIVTLKPNTEKQLLHEYKQALLFKPAYIDIDYKWVNTAASHIDHPLIISCHDRIETSMLASIKTLQEITGPLKQELIIKVAIDKCSPLELFDLLDFLKKVNSSSIKVVAIFTGEKGRFMRLITPLYVPQFSFVSANQESKTDPGQISIDELDAIYQPWKSLKKLPIYALLGNPTAQSKGPFFHNNRFIEKGMESLYVTIDLEQEEAEPFLKRAIASRMFKGFSVTMPYKRAFTSITKTSEPINTLSLVRGAWAATNTDGRAAIELTGKYIRSYGAHMVILGTGGTAKAIANAAQKEGMRVTLISRDKKREVEGFNTLHYDDLAGIHYDVLVQATPAGFKGQRGSIELQDGIFLEGKIFLECVQTQGTDFINKAEQKQGIIIDGAALFKRQAILQSTLWQKA